MPYPAGNFDGIGLEVGMKDKVLTVIAPLKDTPAYRAGIKSGDKILKIEGVLSGTLSYIFNTFSAQLSFSETVIEARKQG